MATEFHPGGDNMAFTLALTVTAPVLYIYFDNRYVQDANGVPQCGHVSHSPWNASNKFVGAPFLDFTDRMHCQGITAGHMYMIYDDLAVMNAHIALIDNCGEPGPTGVVPPQQVGPPDPDIGLDYDTSAGHSVYYVGFTAGGEFVAANR
jgi:hypothetical protein